MSLYIFDMGDVVLLGVRTLRRMAEQYGLEYKEFRADYGLYDKPLMDGFMDPDDYYRHMELKYGIKIDEDLFVKYFDPVLNTTLISYVDMLRKRGDVCVIGSNTFAPHWNYMKIHYKEIVEHFDALYASHLMHITKPVKAFWRHIMEKEGYDARDTFFIDDRLENIEAAESLGIKCLLFRGDNDDLRSFLDL